jgi:uroporphyrinogen-III decarboxylase
MRLWCAGTGKRAGRSKVVIIDVSQEIALSTTDFTQHNQMVKQLWADHAEGRAARVPCVWNFSNRFYLLTPWLNTKGYSANNFFEDPAVQWEVHFAQRRWIRENVPQDMERGLPDEWPGLWPDFQNSLEASWLGCSIEYRDGEVPDTLPMLREDKGKLATMSIPDPLYAGLMGRATEFYQYFEERRAREDFAERPIAKSVMCGSITDGPMTVACDVRGTTEMCMDLYEDPRFARELLDFITEAAIARIRAVGKVNGIEYPIQSFVFADDSIQLISEAQYREFVLPCHLRLLRELALGGPHFMHICGNVQRYIPLLHRELNIGTFDLGFPIDMGQARREGGEDLFLRGNLHPMVLRDGPVELIRQKTAEILRSGVKAGRRYTFCEGNNVAPGTPIEHFAAAYETVLELGRF